MKWTSKVIKVGNSLAIVIPKELCRMHNIEPGDKFDVEELDKSFCLKPVNRKKWDDGYKKWLKKFGKDYKSEIEDLK